MFVWDSARAGAVNNLTGKAIKFTTESRRHPGEGRDPGDIIGVIDGIAFQTNILALNAAVRGLQSLDPPQTPPRPIGPQSRPPRGPTVAPSGAIPPGLRPRHRASPNSQV